ncbi:MAG: N-acetylmuramoyl-L-alanine amidase [Eubacterium sp.]|nr:N-acetylmuramoyl-L-alanine amidase [Eubacterium sp.]
MENRMSRYLKSAVTLGMALLLLVVTVMSAAVSVRADVVTDGWDSAHTKYYIAGKMVTGAKKIEGFWYYFDKETGEAVKNDFQEIKKKKKTKICYYDAEGHAVSGEVKIGKYWYYFQPKTFAMTVKEFVEMEDGRTCYFNKKGRRVKGEKKIGKYWYYFDRTTGAMAVKTTVEIPGKDKTCYYDKNGRRRENYKTDGKWYTFNDETGKLKQTVITIDAGHQRNANTSHEPIGPGASATKAKVTGGAQGVATGKDEYVLTLEIAKLLQKELKARGFKVKLTRTSHDVNISNSQRAKKANKANSSAYVILHADSDGASSNGAHTICNSSSNRFCGSRYTVNKQLATKVINAYVKATGMRKIGVIERDDLSGLNWSKVPTCFIEMGFLSNPSEDRFMSNKANQKKMAEGIANGIESFVKAQKYQK